MKRKAEAQEQVNKPLKKRSKTELGDEEAKRRFRKGLFDADVRDRYAEQHAASSPYRHCVISGLVDDDLLRAVRDEVRANVSFTPKETDIYKIHQSGDLANLDGLDDAALAKLPSLLKLRDALYSDAFRAYVSQITGCGALSGRKTDLAVNVYTPGCFLLCHDDVIGSRRVSFILYLVDPDVPWQASWGGALRLYPVQERSGKGGAVAKTVEPDAARSIPPAWNQLSFFVVQPGVSFHDVEEVYHAPDPDQLAREGGRVRMAISGWFHIPQPGEDGYVEGAEEEQVKNSGLMQLQGDPDQHDLPREVAVPVAPTESEFDEADLEFLLRYISPAYLTPDALGRVSEYFGENSSIALPDILNAKFARRLRAYVTEQEAAPLPSGAAEIEAETPWKVARPPHKHRFLYMQPAAANADSQGGSSPVKELLETFLPSRQFRAWLQMATGCTVKSQCLLARRFRRGQDYTLAIGHDGEERLELNLGFTPTSGWGDDREQEESEQEEEDEEEQEEDRPEKNVGGSSSNSNGASQNKANGKGKGKEKAKAPGKDKTEKNGTSRQQPPEDDFGGHEVYMAGEEDGNEDAAVYKTADGDDDNILFFQAATWNRLTIVLRDRGAMRFVKYVSRQAPGDRWDISAHFDVEAQEADDDGEEGLAATGVLDDTEEEEFKGFSSSDDSDSD